jgi:hypothetical protein
MEQLPFDWLAPSDRNLETKRGRLQLPEDKKFCCFFTNRPFIEIVKIKEKACHSVVVTRRIKRDYFSSLICFALL